jgi:hypothetical protein
MTNKLLAGLIVASHSPFMAAFWASRNSGAVAPSPRMLSWVNIKPAEGDSYLELMLYNKLPEPGGRGTKNHVSLTVPDAEKALAEIKKRAAKGLYTPPDGKPIEIQIGVNRKRQINLYDPDGTRVELMEANTIDGKPAPNSTAPVPHPQWLFHAILPDVRTNAKGATEERRSAQIRFVCVPPPTARARPLSTCTRAAPLRRTSRVRRSPRSSAGLRATPFPRRGAAWSAAHRS